MSAEWVEVARKAAEACAWANDASDEYAEDSRLWAMCQATMLPEQLYRAFYRRVLQNDWVAASNLLAGVVAAAEVFGETNPSLNLSEKPDEHCI